MTSETPSQPMSEAQSQDFVVRWIADGAIFTITRPKKLNSLTKPVLDGLATCLDQLEAKGGRILVITAEGDRAFCAGTDLAEMQGMTMAARLDKSSMARALFVRLSRSHVISIAAINGLAFGGGLELAMACMLRIAAVDATFSLPEIKLGLLPAYAGTQLLPALVGSSRALELMLTGRTIQLAEALAIGLVHRTSAGDTYLVEQALSFGREITCNSPVAIDAIRACVEAAGQNLSDGGLAVEDEAVRAVFPGPDAEAGVTAFLERRKTV